MPIALVEIKSLMTLMRICVIVCLVTGVLAQPDGVFLVDVSQNMLAADSFIAQGARLATYELGSNDRVAVMSFSS
jgi:hypothetical protein